MRVHIALVLALCIVSPAFGETTVGRANVIGVDGPDNGHLCDDANEMDYRCGVGTEWEVADGVSIKSEALYLQSPADSLRPSSPVSGPGDTKRFDHEDAAWIGRIGVDFKIGGKSREPH